MKLKSCFKRKVSILIFSIVLGTGLTDVDYNSSYGYDQPWDGGHQTSTPGWNDPEKPLIPVDCIHYPQPLATKGSPVYIAEGILSIDYTDISLSGRGPKLNWKRTYINQDRYDGPFGYGWHCNYSIRLFEVTDIDQDYVIIRRGDGKRWKFFDNRDGTFTPETRGILHSLVKNPDGSFVLNYTCSDCFNLEGNYLFFSENGFLTAVEDRNGNRLELEYDSFYLLTKVTDALDRELILTYNYLNKVICLTDPKSREFLYEYDDQSNLTKVLNPLGQKTLFVYDGEHDLINVVDAEGNLAFEASYDGKDRVTSSWVYGLQETYSYFPDSSYTVKTNPNGSFTYHYDEDGNVLSLIYPDGTSVSEIINLANRPLQHISESGIVTEYEYDESANVTKMTEAVGTVCERITHYTYDDVLNLRSGIYTESVVDCVFR